MEYNKRIPRRVPPCYFCTSKTEPQFREVEPLAKFLSERGKIVSRMRTGLCSRHQKTLTKQVKYARHLALLPFINRAG